MSKLPAFGTISCGIQSRFSHRVPVQRTGPVGLQVNSIVQKTAVFCSCHLLTGSQRTMKNSVILSIMVVAGISSCGQGNTLAADTIDKENTQHQKPSISYNEKYIDTKYEHLDSTDRKLVVQNSLPKSGIHYTDPSGKKYTYAVFWTRVTNETDNHHELTIDFPAKLSELPSAPGVYYRLLLPPDTMTIDRESLYDYGLTGLKSFLDKSLSKPSTLKRIINPKESSTFYVVTLSNKGVDGPLRTGIVFKGKNIFYRVNKIDVYCGNIN